MRRLRRHPARAVLTGEPAIRSEITPDPLASIGQAGYCLAPGGVCDTSPRAMCLALPYRITEILDSDRAVAEGLEGVRTISTTLVEGLKPGDHVLVAYGAAIREIDAEEATQIAEIWQEMQQA